MKICILTLHSIIFLLLLSPHHFIHSQDISREFPELNQQLEKRLKNASDKNDFDLIHDLQKLITASGNEDEDFYILSNKLEGKKMNFSGFIMKDEAGNIFLADTLAISAENTFSIIHPANMTYPCEVRSLYTDAIKKEDSVPYYYSWPGNTILKNKGFAITLLKDDARKTPDLTYLSSISISDISLSQVPGIDLERYGADSTSKYIQKSGRIPVRKNKQNPTNPDTEFSTIEKLFVKKRVTVEGEIIFGLCSTGAYMALKKWRFIED